MDWRKLLQELSSTINNRAVDNMIYYDKSLVKSNWLGFEGAELEEIKKREHELGASLPPSYKDFLLTTNGFRQISLFAGCLFSIDQIDWTRNKDPEFLELFDKYDDDNLITDDKYFVYDESQRSEYFKAEFLRETLQISEWVDGSVIFLNPM